MDDQQGGFYIGGVFKKIGDSCRQYHDTLLYRGEPVSRTIFKGIGKYSSKQRQFVNWTATGLGANYLGVKTLALSSDKKVIIAWVGSTSNLINGIDYQSGKQIYAFGVGMSQLKVAGSKGWVADLFNNV